jgi:hypothetical protein
MQVRKVFLRFWDGFHPLLRPRGMNLALNLVTKSFNKYIDFEISTKAQKSLTCWNHPTLFSLVPDLRISSFGPKSSER